ncbi:hypothetical protein EJ110_NYTH51239 [Nymphaea thermarum]|nr:hypothetical protein EJ110_NYTH51239 [Nymphaea thermarum]
MYSNHVEEPGPYLGCGCATSVSVVVPAPPPLVSRSAAVGASCATGFCAAAVGVFCAAVVGRSSAAAGCLLEFPPPWVSLVSASGSAFCLGFRVALVFQPQLVTSLCRHLVPPLCRLVAACAPKSENLPVQVTSIRLTKDNYLSWSAALEIGITSRGRLPYITGDKPAPSKTDPQWATWALEDSQVKVWIISSVSADIQPLILRKPTSFDMWTVLAKMYGRKKRVLRTYQIKRSIYSLKQGELSVASFYAVLKTKWEELDYHVNDDWNCDTVSEDRDRQMEGGPVEEQSRDHLFGQVYNRKKKDVVEDVDVTNPNLVSSPDDPSPMNEELPIALHKGTRFVDRRNSGFTPMVCSATVYNFYGLELYKMGQ